MRASVCRFAIVALIALFSVAPRAHAAFHQYRIAEVFSSADGTVQFVRLHCPEGATFQNFFNGLTLTCSNGTTHTLTFDHDLASTNTANTDVLIATANFAALPGGVAPDYIIPAGFLFTGGGTVTFAPGNGIPSVVYAALPTNGQTSVSATGVQGVNTPGNFAGAHGSVNVPPGVCCVAAACSITVQISCTGTWSSGGSCGNNPCAPPPPTGQCCIAAACTVTTEAACTGSWTLSGTCASNPCDPSGVCCVGATCNVSTTSACTGANTIFVSAAACNVAGNAASPCCKANFNHVAGVSVQDIFDFLSAWFAGSPTADITGNGAATPTVQDIFDFLAAWFAGC